MIAKEEKARCCTHCRYRNSNMSFNNSSPCEYQKTRVEYFQVCAEFDPFDYVKEEVVPRGWDG